MPAQGVPISTGTCWRERRANMIALFAGTLPVADVTFFHFRLSSTALSKVVRQLGKYIVTHGIT